MSFFSEHFSIIKEFLTFLKENKLWWMIPMVLVFLLFAALIIMAAAAGPVAPFIYALF